MQTVLLIEQEPHLRQLLQIELADANYNCICVGDGDEAVEVLVFDTVDVVVVGVGWPPHDDLHTLCWVKKYYPHIPVVLFAAEEEVQPRSIIRVADVWVKKCSEIDLLVNALNSLKKRGAFTKAAAAHQTSP